MKNNDSTSRNRNIIRLLISIILMYTSSLIIPLITGLRELSKNRYGLGFPTSFLQINVISGQSGAIDVSFHFSIGSFIVAILFWVAIVWLIDTAYLKIKEQKLNTELSKAKE